MKRRLSQQEALKRFRPGAAFAGVKELDDPYAPTTGSGDPAAASAVGGPSWSDQETAPPVEAVRPVAPPVAGGQPVADPIRAPGESRTVPPALCAWCETEAGREPPAYDPANPVSHGICQRHAQQLLSESEVP